MNDLQIFNSEEFGQIRTVTIDNEPWFVGYDVADALGYKNQSDALAKHVAEEDKQVLQKSQITTLAFVPNRGFTCINESGLYALIFGSKLESAKRFKHWVTSEVLPSIRKTGHYGKPMSIPEQIQLLAKGNVELSEKIEQVDKRIDNLEQDMPLYGCEIEEVKNHISRKGVSILGGKQSEAYHDASIRGSVYSDMYRQLKREYGAVSSYKSIKRKYIADVHDFIDCYTLPRILEEQVINANAQMSFGR